MDLTILDRGLCYDGSCRRPAVDAYRTSGGAVIRCCGLHNRRPLESVPVGEGRELGEREWFEGWARRSEPMRAALAFARRSGFVLEPQPCEHGPALEAAWAAECPGTAVFGWVPRPGARGQASVRWRSHVDELIRREPSEARRLARVGSELLVEMGRSLPGVEPMDGSELRPGESGFRLDAGAAARACLLVLEMEAQLRDEGWVSVMVVSAL